MVADVKAAATSDAVVQTEAMSHPIDMLIPYIAQLMVSLDAILHRLATPFMTADPTTTYTYTGRSANYTDDYAYAACSSHADFFMDFSTELSSFVHDLGFESELCMFEESAA
eukprot:3983795-Pyramimonas_sp.AAC.1